MILPLLLTLVCNTLAYYGTRFVASGWYHFDLSNAWDGIWYERLAIFKILI